VDVFLYLIIVIAFFVLAVTIVTITKRRSEKKQNELEVNQARQPVQVTDVKMVNEYLTDHRISHDMFTQHYNTYRKEFDLHVQDNLAAGSLLVERLRSLDDLINLQLREDAEFTSKLMHEDQLTVAMRHKEWQAFQRGIDEMLQWKPTE
jgi:hypothetical protein